jgi:YgiT-type zinc finger domain-containing protein
MICTICGDDALVPGTTTFAADADGTVVVVLDVPAEVCHNCGESFTGDAIAATMEAIVADAQNSGVESLVRHYETVA